SLTVEDIDSSTVCRANLEVADVDPIIEGVGALNANNLVEGTPVAFTAGQTRPANEFDLITNYRWTFAPGQQQEGGDLRNPTYTYSDQGTKNVCLAVADEDSEVDPVCFDIEVRDLEAIAFFGGPDQAVEGQQVTFDADGTAAGGPADPLSRLVWDFGDGSAPVEVPPGTRFTSHTFENDGVFAVRLTAFDEDSPTTFEQMITITDTVPFAAVDAVYANEERTAYEGVPLTIDGSQSRAGQDEITEYRWDFGDGETTTTAEPTVQHAFVDNGTFDVRLTVVDADDSPSTASVVVTVANVAPTVMLSANEALGGADPQVELGQPVRLVVVTRDTPPGPAPQLTALVGDVAADLPPPRDGIEWDMGDGSAPIRDGFDTEYTFNALGPKVVTVAISDGDGGLTRASIPIEVTAAAPGIETVDPIIIDEGEALNLSLEVTPPPLADGFDTLVVNVPVAPEGAEVEVVDLADNAKRVDVHWTPTYYQAGSYQLQVRATATTAGTNRRRTIPIEVREAGTPRLATVGGTPGRGVLTVYDYGREGGNTIFRAVAEVELGLGAGGLVVETGGQRAFATVPGSDRVAVVNTLGVPRLLRRVPVGQSPAAVAEGPNHVFVVNSGDNTLSAIEKATLKVVATADLAPLDGPADVAWLPAGFDGLASPRLAIVSRRSGHAALVDPGAVLAGRPAIVGSQRLGGALTRVVGDPSTGWLHIADAKARRIYRVSASDLTGGNAAVDGVSTRFAARDLVYRDEALYVATGNAVLRITDDGASRELARTPAMALGTASEQIIAGGALVLATPERVENYEPVDFRRIIDAGGSRVRRLASFVAQGVE
ncbi:MAG: PKD domain-containing protein, partial [Myxococcales bacterium]|nr:PKD domain-containing protein [Myxococcales bacterium]